MSTQHRPPGWYPDPYGEGPLRWYDGGWTQHVRDRVPSAEPEPGPYIDRRTSMGRNYNNGRYPNPYVSDNPSDVWGGVLVIFSFLFAAIMVLVDAELAPYGEHVSDELRNAPNAGRAKAKLADRNPSVRFPKSQAT